ncbi:MAG: mismatch repair protein MutS domain protein [Herbinix sp.]|jgi:hypothetical protein|nr:mismatch repair protein MutS domain protein [Herbinix sp.]
MNLPNLLFCNNDHYIQWYNSSNDFQRQREDLNLGDFLCSLKSISSDFPEEYLYKPCFKFDDATYRLNIMNELFLSRELFSDLVGFNILLKHFSTDIKEYRDTKDEIQKKYRFLSLFREYGSLVRSLEKSLAGCASEGLSALHRCTEEIMKSDCYKLLDQADQLEYEISLIFKNNILSVNPIEKTITIHKRRGEQDSMERLSAMIREYFGIKIKDSFSIVDPAPISVLEKKLLDVLSLQYVDVFLRLESFYTENAGLIDCFVDFSNIHPQFEFYLTHIKLLSFLDGGISICKPVFHNDGFFAKECTCPSLIASFMNHKTPLDRIVRNDIEIRKGGMFLLSGPNQGGKTIYLKAVGLTAYLAKCGCLVFCKNCSLPFYDFIFTHFMQPEVLGRGRLAEEVERIEAIASAITGQSFVLMNESFASTRRKDA